MQRDAAHAGGLKKRVVEELQVFAIIALYLWFFLGLFADYRRLILAETGVSYLHYGAALVEALVIAKVVLLGRMFGLGRRFEGRALIVPVLFKSLLFGVLVVLFGIAEHLVESWVRGKGLAGGQREFASVGVDELSARVLVLGVAFVPFFAFCELGRVLGMRRLATLFFSAAEPAAPGREAG